MLISKIISILMRLFMTRCSTIEGIFQTNLSKTRVRVIININTHTHRNIHTHIHMHIYVCVCSCVCVCVCVRVCVCVHKEENCFAQSFHHRAEGQYFSKVFLLLNLLSYQGWRAQSVLQFTHSLEGVDKRWIHAYSKKALVQIERKIVPSNVWTHEREKVDASYVGANTHTHTHTHESGRDNDRV